MKIFILIGFLVSKVATNEKCLMVEKLIFKMCYFSNVKILFLRIYKGSHFSLKKKSLHFTSEEIKRLGVYEPVTEPEIELKFLTYNLFIIRNYFLQTLNTMQ